jgi:hypothetical protein
MPIVFPVVLDPRGFKAARAFDDFRVGGLTIKALSSHFT